MKLQYIIIGFPELSSLNSLYLIAHIKFMHSNYLLLSFYSLINLFIKNRMNYFENFHLRLKNTISKLSLDFTIIFDLS